MVFVRLSGCNLRCPFCDTDHSRFTEMQAGDVVQAVRALRPGGRVCLTGGEPLLQLDAALTAALHDAGYTVHLETNGTRPLPEGVDWVTLSPKQDIPALKGAGEVVLERADELKLVYDGSLQPGSLAAWARFPATWHFLQPCDTGDPRRNAEILRKTIGRVREPGSPWRLSLQIHKILGIQ